MLCRSGGWRMRRLSGKGAEQCSADMIETSLVVGNIKTKDTIKITMPLLELETCSKSLEGNPQCSSHGSVPDVQAMSHYADCGASVCGPLRPMHFRKHRTMRKM